MVVHSALLLLVRSMDVGGFVLCAVDDVPFLLARRLKPRRSGKAGGLHAPCGEREIADGGLAVENMVREMGEELTCSKPVFDNLCTQVRSQTPELVIFKLRDTTHHTSIFVAIGASATVEFSQSAYAHEVDRATAKNYTLAETASDFNDGRQLLHASMRKALVKHKAVLALTLPPSSPPSSPPPSPPNFLPDEYFFSAPHLHGDYLDACMANARTARASAPVSGSDAFITDQAADFDSWTCLQWRGYYAGHNLVLRESPPALASGFTTLLQALRRPPRTILYNATTGARVDLADDPDSDGDGAVSDAAPAERPTLWSLVSQRPRCLNATEILAKDIKVARTLAVSRGVMPSSIRDPDADSVSYDACLPTPEPLDIAVTESLFVACVECRSSGYSVVYTLPTTECLCCGAPIGMRLCCTCHTPSMADMTEICDECNNPRNYVPPPRPRRVRQTARMSANSNAPLAPGPLYFNPVGPLFDDEVHTSSAGGSSDLFPAGPSSPPLSPPSLDDSVSINIGELPASSDPLPSGDPKCSRLSRARTYLGAPRPPVVRFSIALLTVVTLVFLVVATYLYGNEVIQFMPRSSRSIHSSNAGGAGSWCRPGVIVSASEPPATSVVVIVVAALLQPLFLVGTCGAKLLAAVSPVGESRSGSVSRAHALFEAMRGRKVPCESFLVGELANGTRVVVAPLAAVPDSGHVARDEPARHRLVSLGLSFGWLSYTAVSGTAAALVVGITLMKIMSFIRPVISLSTMDGPLGVSSAVFRFGGLEMTGVAIRPQPRRYGPEYTRTRLELCEVGLSALRLALDVPGESEALCDRRGWLDGIEPPPVGLLPEDMLSQLPSFHAPWLAEQRYESPIPPVDLPFDPPLPVQTCESPPPFTRLEDMLTPECTERLSTCLSDYVFDLGVIAQGPEVKRYRPHACAFAMSCMSPRYQGCVWDFRDGGFAKPLEYKTFVTHLNTDFFEEIMGDGRHSDQELWSHLLHGFRLAPLDEQWYLPPHLFGLACAFDSTQSEIRRLSGLGYSELCGTVPFWPMRGMSCGATPRKYCDRWRRTNDMSNPHGECYDSDGVRIWSVNTAAGFPRWVDGVEHIRGKEVKPSLRGALRDLTIKLHYAHVTGQIVYLFTDDVKDYFNQLRLSDQEHWKSVLVTLAVIGDPGFRSDVPSLTFVVEKQFGFGFVGSSHEAQRLSNVVVDEHARRSLADNRRITSSHRNRLGRKWLYQRRVLGDIDGSVQDRTVSNRMYTDDALLMCVGVAACTSYLSIWHQVIVESGLRMASSVKRQAGVYVIWLGVMIFSVLGVVMVTQGKLMRAQAACMDALANRCEFQNWRRLCGTLEHIRTVNCEPRLATLGFYAPHSQRLEVNDFITITPMMQRGLARWIHVLGSVGGATLFVVFDIADSVHTGGLLAHMSSDAAKEGALVPGLGGYCNGLFWVYPLSLTQLELLVIAVLEFLATLLNVRMFWPFLSHYSRVLQTADALATPQVLVKLSAKSPLMQVALEAGMEDDIISEAVRSGRFFIVHGWGPTNAPGDLVSRGNMVQFYLLMQMLKLRPKQLLVSPRDARIIDVTLAAAVAMRDGEWGVAPPLSRPRITLAAPPVATRPQSAIRRPRARRGTRGGVRHAMMLVALLLTFGDVESHPGPSWLEDMFAEDRRAPSPLRASDDSDEGPPALNWMSDLFASDSGAPNIPREAEAADDAAGQLPGLFENAPVSDPYSLSDLFAGDSGTPWTEFSDVSELQSKRKRVKVAARREKWAAQDRPLAASYQALPRSVESVEAAGTLADQLLNDTSEFALRPTDVGAFRHQVHHLSKLVLAGVKPGTRAADRNGWKYHVAYCNMNNTPIHRPNKAMI